MLYILLVALAGMMLLTTTASADIEDYIKATCEQNGGEWSEKNMACNGFESETEQWNFADALMDRDEYDEEVEQCEEKGGEWSDHEADCDIQDREERAAYEDAVCDDGECSVNSDNDDDVDPCYLDGKRLYPGDKKYYICD
jgi:hypothetical protein